MRSHAFPSGSELISAPTEATSLASALIPKLWTNKEGGKEGKADEEKEKLFRSYAWQRWAWIGTAAAATVIYAALFVRVQLVSVSKDDDEESDDDGHDATRSENADDNDDDAAAAAAAAEAAAETAAEAAARTADTEPEGVDSSP